MDLMDTSHYNLSRPRFEHPLLTNYEANFDSASQLQWFEKNQHVSFYSTIIYLIVIAALYLYMKNRPRYEIRRITVAWNFCLGLFSFLIVLRIAPDILHDVYHYGYFFVLCDSSWLVQCPATAFWGKLFVYSKIVEYGDTVFLVLRKRQLTFLHLYHHISVVLAVFHFANKGPGPGRLVILVNAGVHSIMYTYFGIWVSGYKVPKKISIMITSFQILQFLYAVSEGLHINYAIIQGRKCDVFIEEIALAVIIGASYMILFLNFFYQTYLKKPKYRKKVKKQE